MTFTGGHLIALLIVALVVLIAWAPWIQPVTITYYPATVIAVSSTPFKNNFGSSVRYLVGLKLDVGNRIAVTCMDGMGSNIAECLGLKEGDRVTAYANPNKTSGWSIR